VYGPCFSAIVRDHPLRSLTRRRLGRPLPYQLADGTQVHPEANYSFSHRFLDPGTTCGISNSFELLSHTSGQVTNALLTRSPLTCIATCPFDLHVLGTPPAFILSQDQTLRKKPLLRVYVTEIERQVLASYHFSVVKVLSTKRAVFYPRGLCLSRPGETELPMSPFQHRRARLLNRLIYVSGRNVSLSKL
jgi:hypothetical protein